MQSIDGVGLRNVVLGEDNYYRNHFSLNTDIRDEFENLFGVDMS